MSQVTSAIPSAVENAKRIGVLSSLVKSIITAVVSCALTCIVAIPGTIYLSGQQKQADKDAAKRIADQVLIDHDGQIKLAATVQALGDNLISLSAQMSQANAVHQQQMLDIDHQLKNIGAKTDDLGIEVRTIGQNVLRLSERVK